MQPRSAHRRLGRLTGILTATAVTASLTALPGVANDTAPAANELPPQEPGVTMQIFDIRAPISELCTIKDGQTPNIDRLMPLIDWSDGDFGLEDRFVTHVTANLNVPEDGTYNFRLLSDDGSRLFIDDEMVIDHDGLHAVEPKDGSIELEAGYHSLFVEHFEETGGQILTLQWQPPGASEFEVVPTSVLSTEADVVRVTAPGRKECEGITESPGDGLQLDSVNPNYTLTDLRPDGFEPMVAALDWTEDDELVVVTSGSVSPAGPVEDPEPGEVFILDNVTGDTSAEDVTVTKVATDLLNPMGVAVVDGSIYVSERDRLTELTEDTDGDGMMEHSTLAEWPYGGNFHEFAFGLLHDDENFYVNLSVAIDQGGATTNPQPAENRGTTITVDRETGEVDYVAGGLRTPNGMGWGPGGELFVMDNQGGWLPSSKLVQIEQDRFFNHYTNPAGPFDDQSVTPPVLWLPQNEIGNSPSNPVMLEDGPFAGQLLFGDVTYGGLQRAYLEEVDGEYQGAVFRHSAGLEAGINRTILGPDGAIYVGGIGESGNWSEPGKLRYGLQKLTPNGENVFDMAAVSATPDGFTIDYTQPLSDETVEAIADAYNVTQWRYVPTPAYGGPKVDEQPLRVTSAKVSEDRTSVTLTIPGLREGRVVHLHSPRPFTSVDGEELWNTEAWYTLNTVPGGGEPEPQVFYEAEEGQLADGAGQASNHAGYSGIGFVDGFSEGASTTMDVEVDEAGTYELGLRYANGPTPHAEDGDRTVSLYVNGEKATQTTLPTTTEWNHWATATETVQLDAGVNTVRYQVDDGDTGHVNLDFVSVREPGERIQLFDGTDQWEWQHTDGSSASWSMVGEDAMEVANGDLRTRQAFGDFRLHVEFKVPELPPDVTGQDRGNSGVYLQERYEIQILDSYGDDTLADNEAGAIYQKKAPDSNEALPPGEWQTYDIEFQAARYDDGAKTEDARVTVVWNGVTIHDDVAIDGGTGGNIPESPSTGSIRLQDHGNPVQFRNVWIEPLDEPDTTPPVVDVDLDPAEPDGNAGWYVSPVTATATATDDGEVAGLEVRRADGDWQPYDGAVQIDEDGEHALAFRATDEAGNMSDPVDVDVALDATAPEVTVDGVDDGEAYELGTELDVQASAEDATSGVESVSLELDGEAVDSPATVRPDAGTHELVARAVDNAGNVTENTVTFQVTVTYAGLHDLLDSLHDDGALDRPDYNRLRTQLSVAERAADRGHDAQVDRALDRFVRFADRVEDDDIRELLLAAADVLRDEL